MTLQEKMWLSTIDMDELETIMAEGTAETYDGCIVEPDGVCEHGHQSPLLLLGYI